VNLFITFLLTLVILIMVAGYIVCRRGYQRNGRKILKFSSVFFAAGIFTSLASLFGRYNIMVAEVFDMFHLNCVYYIAMLLLVWGLYKESTS
jgi:hypothetical protein